MWGKPNASPPGARSTIGGKIQEDEIPLVAKSQIFAIEV